jgi:HEAT repeat protein
MGKRFPRPTQQQLDEALAMPDTPDNSVKRREVFWAFEQHEPDVSQIPFIRKALKDEDFGVINPAAIAAGRLGPKGKELQEDLYEAAGYAPRGFAPGAYSECLNALVSIKADEGCILDLVQCHFAITNWYFLRDSLHALKRLGTEEALDLMTRIITFAKPDLDKKQEKYIRKHFPEGFVGESNQPE